MVTVIRSFGNEVARDLVEDRKSKAVRGFPAELVRKARMKLQSLHAAARPEDLKAPAGNRLERLKGKRMGLYSIRINDQWRLVFRFEGGHAYEVAVEDYHR